MSDPARYAIYLAPEEGSALARFVAGILGYDAFSGLDVPHPAGPFPAVDWPAITTDPRRYGAHATLKAPFRLAPGMTRMALEDAMAGFARARRAFDIGPLAVSCIARDGQGGFIALTNPHESAALRHLEADTVRHFGPFRAPLSDAEIARRRPEQLTTRQRQNLAVHGYPFVMGDFAFHITLTNWLPAPEALADHLADRLAQDLGTVRFRVDALYLFEQTSVSARFRCTARFPLSA